MALEKEEPGTLCEKRDLEERTDGEHDHEEEDHHETSSNCDEGSSCDNDRDSQGDDDVEGDQEERGLRDRAKSEGDMDGALSHSNAEDRDDERWELWFQALLKYKDLHGHCNVPRSYDMPHDFIGVDLEGTKKKFFLSNKYSNEDQHQSNDKEV